MGMLRREWTQEEVNKLSFDMAIARAKVYKKWGFSTDEIAKLVDLPESQVRAAMVRDILEEAERYDYD